MEEPRSHSSGRELLWCLRDIIETADSSSDPPSTATRARAPGPRSARERVMKNLLRRALAIYDHGSPLGRTGLEKERLTLVLARFHHLVYEALQAHPGEYAGAAGYPRALAERVMAPLCHALRIDGGLMLGTTIPCPIVMLAGLKPRLNVDPTQTFEEALTWAIDEAFRPAPPTYRKRCGRGRARALEIVHSTLARLGVGVSTRHLWRIVKRVGQPSASASKRSDVGVDLVLQLYRNYRSRLVPFDSDTDVIRVTRVTHWPAEARRKPEVFVDFYSRGQL